jgi:hypothetical protein
MVYNNNNPIRYQNDPALFKHLCRVGRFVTQKRCAIVLNDFPKGWKIHGRTEEGKRLFPRVGSAGGRIFQPLEPAKPAFRILFQ